MSLHDNFTCTSIRDDIKICHGEPAPWSSTEHLGMITSSLACNWRDKPHKYAYNQFLKYRILGHEEIFIFNINQLFSFKHIYNNNTSAVQTDKKIDSFSLSNTRQYHNLTFFFFVTWGQGPRNNRKQLAYRANTKHFTDMKNSVDSKGRGSRHSTDIIT